MFQRLSKSSLGQDLCRPCSANSSEGPRAGAGRIEQRAPGSGSEDCHGQVGVGLGALGITCSGRRPTCFGDKQGHEVLARPSEAPWFFTCMTFLNLRVWLWLLNNLKTSFPCCSGLLPPGRGKSMWTLGWLPIANFNGQKNMKVPFPPS